MPELNPSVNAMDRLWRTTWVLWVLTLLVAICVLVAYSAALRADRAIDDAKEAKALITAQSQYIEDLKTDVNIYSNRITRLDSYLKAKGVPIEDIYDE